MRRDLVLLSGGLDSSTALAQRTHAGTAALALSVSYGQRHGRELDAARRIADHYRVPHHVLDLSGWGALITGSAVTDPTVDVPHGHYAAPNMAVTVVPNRNAVFLMAAAGIAQAHDCTHVVAAVHAGDHTVYPDCRPEFVDAAATAAALGTGGAVTITAPFVTIDKTAIAGIASALGVPVGLTWSCYEGGDTHCGQCGTCVERREALSAAGAPDPTHYADTEVPS